MKNLILLTLLGVSAAAVASAATTCTYVTTGTRMVLQSDCTTDAPIIVPNGMTHDGAGHKISAIDPPGDHFRGAVIQNGGASANVVDTVIETNIEDYCQSGPDKLAGILFDGAAGTITHNTILSLNKNSRAGALSGCQEGHAIEAVNFGSMPGTADVKIDNNTIRNYQKTGILVSGDVNGTIVGNTVTGAGPQGFIGQNGIQIGGGAAAHVRGNTVTGNAYTGSEKTASGGIIVPSGPLHHSNYSFGIEIESNTLVGNDVGVWLEQMNERRESPVVATRASVVNNTITNDAVTNHTYQAGITAHGHSDSIKGNRITGAGYDPATAPGSTLAIDEYEN